MDMNKVVDFIAWVIIAFAAAVVAYIRIDGIDMTEGQILVAYFPLWLMVFAACFTACGVLLRPRKR